MFRCQTQDEFTIALDWGVHHPSMQWHHPPLHTSRSAAFTATCPQLPERNLLHAVGACKPAVVLDRCTTLLSQSTYLPSRQGNISSWSLMHAGHSKNARRGTTHHIVGTTSAPYVYIHAKFTWLSLTGRRSSPIHALHTILHHQHHPRPRGSHLHPAPPRRVITVSC